jgi:hypothetical protein
VTEMENAALSFRKADAAKKAAELIIELRDNV